MNLRLLVFFIFAGWAGPVAAGDLSDYPFFEAVSGAWVGEGELTNSDGVVTSIHEDWTGEMNEEGAFVMAGSRNFGDELQEFHWKFSFNSVTEFIECEYWHTGMNEPSTFEIVLTDVRIELRTPFGGSSGVLLISNSISEGKIEGEVSVVNGNGEIQIGGQVTHRKAG